MRARYAILILGAILLLGACDKGMSEKEEIYLNTSKTEADGSRRIFLSVASKVIFEYDENSCQIAYNASKKQFRVMSDNMKEYYLVRCEAFPKAGEKIKAELKYTSKNEVHTIPKLNFEVIDVDGETGVIRLWNEKNSIGATIVAARY